MDANELKAILSALPLGQIHYYDRIGSTNVEAARWAEAGASDLTLVVADEQTAGKGRHGRTWFTPPGAALAFSLVLRPPRYSSGAGEQASDPARSILRLTALGALAVCEALRSNYRLQAQIKWPNDVLLEQRKTAGILAEAHWQGSDLSAVILGIGINIASLSVPPEEQVTFPATCVEVALGRPVARFELLRQTLERLVEWYGRLDTPAFIQTWDKRLAFKGEWVNVFQDGDPENPPASLARLIGLDDQGRLRLVDRSGEAFTLMTGELRLRPADI